jgi:glycosyltransferase involved in cell wall biosynthesis
MSNKKISMIMPCYNSEPYLDVMLNSIAAQTYSNIELIVGYDLSTDNTFKKLMEWIPKFEARGFSMKIVENQERCGVSGGINKALQHFTGDFLTFPDSDDYMQPAFCQTMVDSLDNNKNYNYASCDNYIVMEADFDAEHPELTPENPTITHAHDAHYYQLGDRMCYLLGLIPRAPWRLMVRADYFRRIFPNLRIYPHPSSQELPFRLFISKEPFLHVQKCLYTYILYADGYTQSRRNSYHTLIPYYDSMEILGMELISLIDATAEEKERYLLANRLHYLSNKIECLFRCNNLDILPEYMGFLKSTLKKFRPDFNFPEEFDINVHWRSFCRLLPNISLGGIRLPSYMFSNGELIDDDAKSIKKYFFESFDVCRCGHECKGIFLIKRIYRKIKRLFIGK